MEHFKRPALASEAAIIHAREDTQRHETGEAGPGRSVDFTRGGSEASLEIIRAPGCL